MGTGNLASSPAQCAVLMDIDPEDRQHGSQERGKAERIAGIREDEFVESGFYRRPRHRPAIVHHDVAIMG